MKISFLIVIKKSIILFLKKSLFIIKSIKYILNAGKNKMWFDYEALFKKTKSFVLKQDINIEVDHTDFDNDIVARDCLSDGKENYAYYINNILNGDISI